MKKIIFVIISFLFIVSGCSVNEKENDSYKSAIVFGTSLVDLIVNSNIEIVATTTDALESKVIEDVENIGTMLSPNIEMIINLNPDVVILSDKYPNYNDVVSKLANANINTLSLTYNSFDEYKDVVTTIAEISNDDLYYNKMVEQTQDNINTYIDKASSLKQRKALILRSSNSTIQVLDDTYFSNEIIENMNLTNIASTDDKFKGELSIEYIVEEDPDYIFIVYMGNDGEENINRFISENDAWSTLSAYKNNNIKVLPKDLFHNKPNQKWDEAYEYIYEIIK